MYPALKLIASLLKKKKRKRISGYMAKKNI
jgi:hypothetical protein